MRRIVTFEVPAGAAPRAGIVARVAAVMPAKEGVDFEVYEDGDDLRLELDDRRGAPKRSGSRSSAGGGDAAGGQTRHHASGSVSAP